MVREMCATLKIEHNFSTPYHHETLGTVERNHRNFNEYLRSYLTDNNWDVMLQYFTFCYNTSPHGAFEFKYTPFELVHARKCNIPEQLMQKIEPIYNLDNFMKVSKHNLQLASKMAQSLINKIKIRNKEYFDKNTNPIKLAVGDSILLRKEPYNKHGQIYAGPYTVVEINHPNVTIKVGNKNITIHKNRIVLAK